MDDSPLNKLPPELRNRIYSKVLVHQESIKISYRDLLPSDKPFSARTKTSEYNEDLLALTRTCRQIWTESTQLFYAANTFVFTAKDHSTYPLIDQDCWLGAIGEANRRVLGTTVVEIAKLYVIPYGFSASWEGQNWDITIMACRKKAVIGAGHPRKVRISFEYRLMGTTWQGVGAVAVQVQVGVQVLEVDIDVLALPDALETVVDQVNALPKRRPETAGVPVSEVGRILDEVRRLQRALASRIAVLKRLQVEASGVDAATPYEYQYNGE